MKADLQCSQNTHYLFKNIHVCGIFSLLLLQIKYWFDRCGFLYRILSMLFLTVEQNAFLFVRLPLEK